MKRKTVEKHLLDIALALLLMFSIGTCMKVIVFGNVQITQPTTLQDLHQQQEMRDYHQSQGRDLKPTTNYN